ncbi:hypothetical protein AB14_4916 [Escherichia coli 1-392-07_S1_C1]|nr:hypothetical protein AB14_4916 [Escherichia coli 1-392-07_S1_C1]
MLKNPAIGGIFFFPVLDNLIRISYKKTASIAQRRFVDNTDTDVTS